VDGEIRLSRSRGLTMSSVKSTLDAIYLELAGREEVASGS
jgi:hypothetical protein